MQQGPSCLGRSRLNRPNRLHAPCYVTPTLTLYRTPHTGRYGTPTQILYCTPAKTPSRYEAGTTGGQQLGAIGGRISPVGGAKRLPWQMPQQWTPPYAQHVNDLPGLISAVTANGEKWVSGCSSRKAWACACACAELRTCAYCMPCKCIL